MANLTKEDIRSVIEIIKELYLEDMVSEETADFVKEHLAKCAECSAELDAMKTQLSSGSLTVKVTIQ